jgi:hypothetical protein
LFSQKWSADLAILAQNYASQCVYGHNRNRDGAAGFDKVGENIAWNSSKANYNQKQAVGQQKENK